MHLQGLYSLEKNHPYKAVKKNYTQLIVSFVSCTCALQEASCCTRLAVQTKFVSDQKLKSVLTPNTIALEEKKFAKLLKLGMLAYQDVIKNKRCGDRHLMALQYFPS